MVCSGPSSCEDRCAVAVRCQSALRSGESLLEEEGLVCCLRLCLRLCCGNDDIVICLIQRDLVGLGDHIVHQHLDLCRIGRAHCAAVIKAAARVVHRCVQSGKRMLVPAACSDLCAADRICVYDLADHFAPVNEFVSGSS